MTESVSNMSDDEQPKRGRRLVRRQAFTSGWEGVRQAVEQEATKAADVHQLHDDEDVYADIDAEIEQEIGGEGDDDHIAEVIDINDILNRQRAIDSMSQEDIERRFATRYYAQAGNTQVFLTLTLAEDVMAIGPLALGTDWYMWAYKDGVWYPYPEVIRHRVAKLMGERYRSNHPATVQDHITSRLVEEDKVIRCDPVSQFINFKNGLLDWKTGKLHAHTPDILTTVQLNAEWNPKAKCPEFDKFLASVVDADMIPMVWELIGYLMYSGNPLHKAVMFTGKGRNGKGTLLRAITALLGEENVSAVTLQALSGERGFSRALLFNKLANIAGDIDGTYIENTGRFKEITGQDEVDAEHKGQKGFKFKAWAVPVFSANKVPGSADVSAGYLSRWVVVNFPNSFEGQEDRTLDERLGTDEELQGIAAKAVPALRRLLERGNFEEPDSARRAREEFNREVDRVRVWADENADVNPDWGFINRTVLYNNYKEWAHQGGYGQMNATEFYRRLEGIGCRPAKVKGVNGFYGLKLTEDNSGW